MTAGVILLAGSSLCIVAAGNRPAVSMDLVGDLSAEGTGFNAIPLSFAENRGQFADPIHYRAEAPGAVVWLKRDAVYYQFIRRTEDLSAEDRLAGFLRLSLPGEGSPATGLVDLDGAAIIREVHVFGQSLAVGAEQNGAAQHSGLGTELLQRAEAITRKRGYERLAVISAVGTRRYYLERGFERGELYLVKKLDNL